MDRRNRWLCTLVALLLAAAGAGGLLAGFGALRAVPPETPVLPPGLVAQWATWGPWAPAGLAVAGLAVAWLGWRLVRAELRPLGRTPMPDLEIEATDGRLRQGSTRLRGSAVVRGLERLLEGVAGVEHARVGLSGAPHRPEVRAQLDVDANADLDDVRKRVERVLESLDLTTGVPLRSRDLAVRLVRTGGKRRMS